MPTDVAGPVKDTRKMNYPEYIVKFVFTSVVIKGDEMPQCVICYEMRANEPLKVNKLMSHLKIKHVSLAYRAA